MVVAFPKSQILDVVGPIEVLSRVATIVPGGGYEIELVASGDAITTTSGLDLAASRRLSQVSDREAASLDTLIIAGGAGAVAACDDDRLTSFIRRTSPVVRRTTAICTGAFLLGEAGVLSGRRAVTHWSHLDEFRARYPDVALDADAIYVRDVGEGEVWTSAGVTAGIDLTLAMVRDDFGAEVALAVARDLVMFMVRPGGQTQFSAQLVAQAAEGKRTARAVAHVLDHPRNDLSVPALAALVNMTERTFSRIFRQELGMTPAQFVERARVDAARRLLEAGEVPIKRLFGLCGFRDEETMRRAFLRQLGVNPTSYQVRFGAVA
jgi:transcriptional regulator GlxA family with amidase domain